MRTVLKVVIFSLLVSLISALAYREVLIREYPIDIRRYQSYVRNVLTEDYKIKFIEKYPELNGSYSKSPQFLLMWLGERLNYTDQENMTRHDEPIEILEYGWGRCHEFSLVYLTLMSIQGYTPRLVMDDSPKNDITPAKEGDHIWVEYNLHYNHWTHVDPTQGAVWTQNSTNANHFADNPYVDNPLMYERDWGKDVTRVWGIEPDMCERIEENYQYEI